jgi:hypothetical protein
MSKTIQVHTESSGSANNKWIHLKFPDSLAITIQSMAASFIFSYAVIQLARKVIVNLSPLSIYNHVTILASEHFLWSIASVGCHLSLLDYGQRKLH